MTPRATLRWPASGTASAAALVGLALLMTAAMIRWPASRSWALPTTLVVLVVAAALLVWQVMSRDRAAGKGTDAESMLEDLRDRLRSHGDLPPLPAAWHAEASLHPAYGHSFSGDFVVADRSADGRRLEVALVDVSGKGLAAGTRALQLSGAMGGLLGATAPERFLAAANAYLLRQGWEDGFATAVFVSVDLDSGGYVLASAGHPPGVHYSAGSGRWDQLDADGGPALGILSAADGAAYGCRAGTLAPGDALLLYTDGVVEARDRDLSVGIDRMLGAAERLVSGGFAGGAARLSASAWAGETDDRAVVLLWRT